MAPPHFTKITSTNTDDPERALPTGPTTAESTPQRLKLSGYMRLYSGHAYIRAIPSYRSLAKEMRGMWVGPMPVIDFLNAFLPYTKKRTCEDIEILMTDDDFKAQAGRRFNEGKRKSRKAEDKICDTINEKNVFTNLYFINTSDDAVAMLDGLDESEKADRKCDISVMLRRRDGRAPLPSFDGLVMPMELKPKVDIVADPTGESSEERKTQGLEAQSDKGLEARGQLSAYSLHKFQHQDCAHGFSVFISGMQARLLRTDHSGVVVTKAFDYTKGPLFTEFLWRLDRALDSDEDRAANADSETGSNSDADTPSIPLRDDAGIDTSVIPLEQNDDVVKKARKAFEEARDELPYMVTPQTPLRKVQVWDEYSCAPDQKPEVRTLIAAPSVQHSHSPLGRYTLSFPVYDPATDSVCWMKDAWRLDEEGFEKEDVTYAKLRALADLQGLIPEVLCAGDVRRSDGGLQETKTKKYVKADWAAGSHGVHRYVHYRIVFKTVGRPLTAFKNTKELVQVIADALKAHSIAFNDGDILHRDISINNILIKNGRGLLIDWDMCKHLDANEPRIPWRTGTWQFIAAQLLTDPKSTTHALRHDLESFLWLLLYVILRYHYRIPQLSAPVAHITNERLPPKLDLPPPTKRVRQNRAPQTAMPQDQMAYMGWAEVQKYVHHLFDDKKEEGELTPKGGAQKIHFLLANPGHPQNEHISHAIDDSNTRIPPPLATLIAQLRGLFAPLYIEGVPAREIYDYEEEHLASANYVEHYFKAALEAGGWRDDDAGQDHFKFEKRSRKRERDAEDELEAEDGDEDAFPTDLKTFAAPTTHDRKRQRMEPIYESPTPRRIGTAPARLG